MKAQKFYIYRISERNGKKEYKRTKCLDKWTTEKSVCWQFSKQGAKKIVACKKEYDRSGHYTFGIEPVE